MSHKRRRNPEPKIDKSVQSHDAIKFVSIVIAIILASVPFVMGKYIEFNSPGPFDSAAYVYSAKHILDGARLGVEEKTSAQPGTLLVNIIGVGLFGFNETGPKLMQGLLQAVALVLMFYTVGKLFGSLGAIVSVTIASVCLSAPVIAKFGNVKEQYMIAFMVISACCFILYQLSGKWWQALLCGAAAINICYFKETGASVIIAMIVYLIAQPIMRNRTWRKFLLDIALLAAGCLIGLCPIVFFYLKQGQFDALLNSFPVLAVKSAFAIALVILPVCIVIGLCIRYRIWRPLRQVRLRIWIIGLIMVVILITSCTVYIVRHKDAIDGDAVSYLKSIPFIKSPHKVIIKVDIIIKRLQSGMAGYVGSSWKAYTISEQASKVMRYYGVLKVPIILAIAAILAGFSRFVMRLFRGTKTEDTAERLVLLLSVWWILDMAFVWISPRSYEQYYLPLNASAAMLGGYIFWLYTTRLNSASHKGGWILGGAIGGLFIMAMLMLTVFVFLLFSSGIASLLMLAISILFGYAMRHYIRRQHNSITKQKVGWMLASGIGFFLLVVMLSPIFFGFSTSPDTGTQYVDQQRNPEKRRGFAQSLKGVSIRKKGQIGAWELAGDYIRNNSDANENIYVWGWVPGIYVRAQRLSSVPEAFESEMHVKSPRSLSYQVRDIVEDFKKDPPKFIVDSRKRHFPWKSPPLELWPKIPKGFLGAKSEQFLPNDDKIIEAHGTAYFKFLTDNVGPDEAERFNSMELFRKYVMDNYKVVRMFGAHVLFERKTTDPQN